MQGFGTLAEHIRTSKEKVNEPNDEYMNTNTFKRQNVSPPACCVEVKFPKARA